MRNQWVTRKRFWGFLAALVLTVCLVAVGFADGATGGKEYHWSGLEEDSIYELDGDNILVPDLHVSSIIVDEPASCQQTGRAHADLGNGTNINVIIDIQPHNCMEYENGKEATCTDTGCKVPCAQCKDCGAFFRLNGDHLYYGTGETIDSSDLIQPLGHDYSGDPEYVWSDDNTTVTGTIQCQRDGCGEKLTETVNTTAETTEPTCTEGGFTVFTAAFTKEGFTAQTKKVDGDPATGHDFGEWTQTKAPTCTEKGEETRTCQRCGVTETRELEAMGHDFGEWTQTKAPTCTEKGEEARTCQHDGCGAKETRELDALGHDLENHAAQAATCSEPGWEAYDTCRREGCGYTTFKEIPALGHDWGEWVLVTPPSCNGQGVEMRTCKNEGCDILVETRYLDPDPSAHEWSQWTVTTEATCTKMGVETRICKDCALTETRPADMLPHTPEEIPAVPATCLEPGSTAGSRCSVCGTILLEPDSTDPTGHDWGPWVTVAEPTEEAYGLNERVCRNDSSHRESWRLPKLKNEADGLAEGLGGVLEDILLHRTNISGDPVYVHTGEEAHEPLTLPEGAAAEGKLTFLGGTGIGIVLPADLQARTLKEEQIEEEGILGCYVKENGCGVLVLDADLEVTDLSVYRAVVEKAGGQNIQDLNLNGLAAFSYCLPDRDAVYLAANSADGVLLEIAFFRASDKDFMQEAGQIAATLQAKAE